MSPWDIPFCRRKLRIVSPIFMLCMRGVVRRSQLHSNQSSTLWQEKNYETRNNSRSTQRFTLAFQRVQSFSSIPQSLLQGLFEKGNGFVPRVGSILLTISIFIVGILEGVSCIGVNRDFNLLAELLHCRSELLQILRRDSTIILSEKSQDRSVDLFHRHLVSGQASVIKDSVIDDIGGESRLLNRQADRITTSHAPADCADPFLANTGLRFKILKRSLQIACSALTRYATHELMGLIRSGGYFSAIEIDRESHITLVGQLRRLLFHPSVQPPPLMNNDERRKRSFAFRR